MSKTSAKEKLKLVISLIVICVYAEQNIALAKRQFEIRNDSKLLNSQHQSNMTKPKDDLAPWTVMIYAGVDSSAEAHIMPHLDSLAASSEDGQDAEFVLLIDRAPGYSTDSTTLGENFEDTRLFSLEHGNWKRVGGGRQFPEITEDSTFEANSGDGRTLAKFIEFAKQNYPASNYALILFGHGECRSVCPDLSSVCKDSGENEDPLFTAEITESLDQRHSVDLLWIDACAYGSVENAYQMRPANNKFSAEMMMATPPNSSPAPMGKIFEELQFTGSKKKTSVNVDAQAFGKAAIEATLQHVNSTANQSKRMREAWALYDLREIQNVKDSMDRLSRLLVRHDCKTILEKIRGQDEIPVMMHYMHIGERYAWLSSAHFDLFDLAERIRNHNELPEVVRSSASAVATDVDKLIVESFGGGRYEGFNSGKNGIYIVFPKGDAQIRDKTHWTAFRWYHPSDMRTIKAAFGNLDWCSEGAEDGNQVVENWFELLDCWYDKNDEQGGNNAYRW